MEKETQIVVKDDKEHYVPRLIDFEDYQRICFDLENFHGVFATLARYGRFYFDKVVPTAAVMFNKDGDLIRFVFNPDFWKRINHYSRLWVVCHECLHIINNHGVRLQHMKAMGFGPDMQPVSIGNIATDITINERLLTGFDFDRFKLDDDFEFDSCYIDTVFKGGVTKKGETVKKNECAEYYYNLILDGTKKIDVVNFDDHSGLGEMDEDTKQKIKDILEDNLSPQEKEDFLKRLKKASDKEFEKAKEENGKDKNGKPQKSEKHEAGTIAGHIEKMVEKAKYKPKKKFEAIIRNWVKYHMGGYKHEETWLFDNNKTRVLELDVLVPGEKDDEPNKEKRKLDLLMVCDSSGSCTAFADRFWKVCHTIPRHRFNIQLACFDTELYPLTFKDTGLKGFGGTAFGCITDWIKNKDIKYDAVFVVTDGYSSDHPDIPIEKQYKWHWLLTEGGSKECIPKKCKIWDLSKFE